MFNAKDHAKLSTLFDPHATYAGYRPEVREAPNGDTKVCPACSGIGTPLPPGRPEICPVCRGTGHVPNVDAGRAGKRFLHVAPKYNPPAWAVEYLARAHYEACRVAEALGVPAAYYPRTADGTLRVLEYPSAGHQLIGGLECRHCREPVPLSDLCPALAPGAGTAEHTDFDLFTIVLWRSHPADLQCAGHPADRLQLESLSPGLHIGEIGELVGLGPATPHRVPARPYAQKSVAYFAMPDHGALLPDRTVPGPYGSGVQRGATVGAWLKERIARSRY